MHRKIKDSSIAKHKRILLSYLLTMIFISIISPTYAKNSIAMRLLENVKSQSHTLKNPLIDSLQKVELVDDLIHVKPTLAAAPEGVYSQRLVVKFQNHIPIREENFLQQFDLAELQLAEKGLTLSLAQKQSAILSNNPRDSLSQPLLGEKALVEKFEANPTRLQEQLQVMPQTKLVFEPVHQNGRDRQKMQTQGPLPGVITQELQELNTLLNDPRVNQWERLFSRSVSELMLERFEAEKNASKELADLANYFVLNFVDETAALEFKAQLDNLAIVSTVYFPPIPENADIAPTTPSFEGSQGYLESASTSNGIDARYAWDFTGGRGELIKVIDIESGWNSGHEDLPEAFYTHGLNYWGQGDKDHGTAVLGQIVGIDDGSGITGIANQAQFGFSSVVNGLSVQFDPSLMFANVASAINVASSVLDAGDVILIEQHARGPGNDLGCTCNCSQWRYVAMEYWQAEFDAIQIATARGVVVVEAAGNGGQNLDNSRYDGRFNRTQRDSGAIFVGGGTSNNRAPMCWTNFGSRLDLQGWGQNVMTAGYGDQTVVGAEEDQNQWYTTSFSGTSSASPIVVGAVAILQGIQKAQGNVPFTPNEIRNLLINNGNAQTGTRPIGPLPDLKLTLDSLGLTPENQEEESNPPNADGSCTVPAEFSGECGGKACVNKPAGMVGGDCFLGIPFFCEDSYMTYHTDQFICAE